MAEYDYDHTLARETYKGREIRVYGTKPAPVFDGTTTNKQDYIPHALEQRPVHAAVPYAGGLPFDGQSTYATEYPAHQLPERAVHSPHQYKPTPAQFDGTTTYKTNYVPHQIEPQSPNRAIGQRVSLPFDGTSSYRSDFTQHALPERPVAGQLYHREHVPFDGASTYKGDFVPHALEPRPQHSPTAARQPLPFDGSTTYGEYFRPYPIQAHAAPRMGEYRPNPAKFEGVTENMEKYRAWAIDTSNRNGGGPPPMRPSLPFEGTTTNREMFQGWQLPPKRPALGVQMVGDAAYVLIPPTAAIPAVGRQTFTTVHDRQTEMRILVLEGDFNQASRCNVLGHFDLSGLPPGPKGSAKVEVTFYVNEHGVLNVTACDLDTHRQEQWLRDGYLVAHVAPQAAP